MAFVEINPHYRTVLEELGLRTAEDFLALPAVIQCGHPDRNVGLVRLGSGDSAMPAFLKREHRIRWKDRLQSALAGFGPVTKSERERLTIEALSREGIGCAEWIAAGEHRGRAFLLLRALTNARDLRVFLSEQEPRGRHRFAQKLGAAIARLHNAGFQHRDLYSKHILVDPNDGTPYFLDLQRTCSRRPVNWKQRWSDLAALDATVADDLLSRDDRLTCLRAYLRHCRLHHVEGTIQLMHSACHIFSKTTRLLPQRRIQESRRVPSVGNQTLLWLDGEALCVTPEFHAQLGGELPGWLKLASLPASPRNLELCDRVWLGPAEGFLIRRRRTRILEGLWNWMLRRRGTSPELRQAGLMFRLGRAGIETPRLLAFGQRQVVPWRTESFLLSEASGLASVACWLATAGSSAAHDQTVLARRRLVRDAAVLVRRLHDLHYYLNQAPGVRSDAVSNGPLMIRQRAGETPAVILGAIRHLVGRRRGSRRLAQRDLRCLYEVYVRPLSRTDALRFFLTYLGIKSLTPAAEHLARSLAPRSGMGSRRDRKGHGAGATQGPHWKVGNLPLEARKSEQPVQSRLRAAASPGKSRSEGGVQP
jgi:Lipopolysaccharide kinase (Kdo/WaaP) family